MAGDALSPWEAALGDGVDRLSPALRRYVRPLPSGATGLGEGVFDVVGSPRMVVRPLLVVLGALGIAFPVWAHDVPFTVRNRRIGSELAAERVFRLAGGDRVMRDRVRAVRSDRGRVVAVDRLGPDGLIEFGFAASEHDGELRLRSVGAAVRVGGRRVRIPRALAPRARLRERTVGERQRVEFEVDLPVLGRIYEYAGDFDYRIEQS
ncbi:MAG: DUF4166 domain-containing protein [Actinomycetales bacterium]|nr:DUF4166 domain-containing protein [Actinomycetales bacterium]